VLTGRTATLTGRIVTALILSAVLVALGTAGPAAWPARGAAGSAGQQARASDLAQLAGIDVPAAWRVTRGRGVTVGVLDTGVNGSVPDLRGSVTTGPDFARGADPPGYRPPHWHGTFIASLIAGHGSGAGRASGIVGVAPAARILSVRVILDDDEPGFPIYNTNAHYEDAIASGIRYAVRHGVAVINMSLGSASAARPVRAAVGYAISRGVVVVASAGNNGAAPGAWSRYSYPASFTGVISVGAVDADHQRAPFSDRNASVVICAPGVAVVGAAPRGGYLAVNGTSPASAFVAGVAALIKSRYPRLSPALVRQALVSSARHRPAGGYSRSAGFGEVDAAGALADAARLAAQRPEPGLAPAAHFGPGRAAGPIRVVHRDAARIAGSERLALAAAAGFLIALAALAVVILRSVRRPARPGSGPGAGPGRRLAGPAGPYEPAVTTAESGSRSRRR
jgi:type VII secretion-associated serine protease mycosin